MEYFIVGAVLGVAAILYFTRDSAKEVNEANTEAIKAKLVEQEGKVLDAKKKYDDAVTDFNDKYKFKRSDDTGDKP
jgi:hypothetical protein